MLLVGLLACSVFDLQAPEVDVSWMQAPGPTNLPVRLFVRADDANPGSVEVRLGERVLATGTGPVTLPSGALPQGPSTVLVRVTDGSVWAHQTEVEVEVLVDTEPPELSLLHDLSGGQGRTVVVVVRSDEGLVDPVLHAFEHDLPLYAEGDGYRAFVGVPLEAVPGPVELVVEARDRAGNRTDLRLPLTVEAVDYPKGGTIRLTKAQVEARKDDEAKAAMRAARDAAYALERPVAAFTLPFQQPVQGRRTSPFGVFRTYSDGAKSFHTGLDLANAEGTPVVAAAAGEVVLAEEQPIFGNAVIVHHGQGVTTSYNHLSRIDCAVGDVLAAGDPVGLLGTTGQSTGPHLHFSMVVGEEAVDPDSWLSGDILP